MRITETYVQAIHNNISDRALWCTIYEGVAYHGDYLSCPQGVPMHCGEIVSHDPLIIKSIKIIYRIEDSILDTPQLAIYEVLRMQDDQETKDT